MKAHSNDTVESLLSPSGILKKYNNINGSLLFALDELPLVNNFNFIMDDAIEAFLLLLENRKRFFSRNNEEIELIVFGQRLGQFLANSPKNLKNKFQSSTEIPLKFSSDRRTAALGAAYSFACL